MGLIWLNFDRYNFNFAGVYLNKSAQQNINRINKSHRMECRLIFLLYRNWINIQLNAISEHTVIKIITNKKTVTEMQMNNTSFICQQDLQICGTTTKSLIIRLDIPNKGNINATNDQQNERTKWMNELIFIHARFFFHHRMRFSLQRKSKRFVANRHTTYPDKVVFAADQLNRFYSNKLIHNQ